MSESIYKFIELVGSSSTSWEDAAKNAVETAGSSLKDLRIAEITRFDIRVKNGKVKTYRARVDQSFKIKSKEQFYSLNKLMGMYA